MPCCPWRQGTFFMGFEFFFGTDCRMHGTVPFTLAPQMADGRFGATRPSPLQVLQSTSQTCTTRPRIVVDRLTWRHTDKPSAQVEKRRKDKRNCYSPCVA